VTTLHADILGVGVWGPGLEGWLVTRPILAGDMPYEPRTSPAPPPALLPATERRRTGPVVRLALAVAHEAALASGLPPGDLRCVFGSSNGDGVVVGGILHALATARAGGRVVSPTAFHNSVHNAAAGYWSIATASTQPATCLGCHDWTWAAALLNVMVDVTAEDGPALLCCYDHPLPEPLAALRPTVAPLGTALVLAPPGNDAALARLSVRFDPGALPPYSALCTPGLESLLIGNAVGPSLRLLEALALGGAHTHAVAYLDGQLQVSVQG